MLQYRIKRGAKMAVVRILQYPDPLLKRKGVKVTEFDARIKQIIDDMFETHYAQQNCPIKLAEFFALIKNEIHAAHEC